MLRSEWIKSVSGEKVWARMCGEAMAEVGVVAEALIAAVHVPSPATPK